MLSLALSGDFHYLDARSSKPVQTLHGHQKGITAYVKRKDKTFFTGSYDGRVLSWADLTADPKTLDVEHASPKILSGKGHTNQVSALSNSDDLLVSVGLDDTVRSIDSKKLAYTYVNSFVILFFKIIICINPIFMTL
jgi:WD40 repeat protein